MTWIKKKIGPGIYNLTTVEDAQRILTNETKVVLGFLNSLVVSINIQISLCIVGFMLVNLESC